jgi:hypothetical protein
MLKTRSTVETGQAFRLRSLNFQEKDDQNSSFEVQVLDRRAQAASAPGKIPTQPTHPTWLPGPMLSHCTQALLLLPSRLHSRVRPAPAPRRAPAAARVRRFAALTPPFCCRPAYAPTIGRTACLNFSGGRTAATFAPLYRGAPTFSSSALTVERS